MSSKIENLIPGFCGAMVVAAFGLIVFVLCSTPPSLADEKPSSPAPETAKGTDTISKTTPHPDTTTNKNTDVQRDAVLSRRQVQ